MGKAKVGFLAVLCLMANLLLVACNNATATPPSASTTTPPSGYESVFTPVFSEIRPGLYPTPSGSPVEGGDKVIIPEDGSFPGSSKILKDVLTTSNNFNSIRITLNKISGVPMTVEMVVVKPDKFSVEYTIDGKKSGMIGLGDEYYVNSDGTGWQKTDKDTEIKNISVDLDKEWYKQVAEFAGGTFSVMPDELLNGKKVGVVQIDSATSTTDHAVNSNYPVLTYMYDKQSLLLQKLVIKSGSYIWETLYQDYNSPKNSVQAPK